MRNRAPQYGLWSVGALVDGIISLARLWNLAQGEEQNRPTAQHDLAALLVELFALVRVDHCNLKIYCLFVLALARHRPHVPTNIRAIGPCVGADGNRFENRVWEEIIWLGRLKGNVHEIRNDSCQGELVPELYLYRKW